MNLLTTLQALRELGPTALTLNALYKLGLKTGRFRTPPPASRPSSFSFQPSSLLSASSYRLYLSSHPNLQRQLMAEADQILEGCYPQFGGDPVDIQLNPPTQRHWTECETQPSTIDIKLVWETARFGWAFTLGRAFHASGDERYAAAFWRYFETFQAANPPYRGENWISGQEVGLRLMALTWAGQVFRQAKQTTPARLEALTAAIGIHAARIPATLLYARSQNNNHLLSEAAALYTASLVLPKHPQAPHWHKTGQKWLRWCFEHQIDADGEYVQHSTNYHRLMLQVALWLFLLERGQPKVSPLNLSLPNLQQATRWLLARLDPETGGVPNLGANDGAYIFPLTSLPFNDFRPVAQAAARAFLGSALKPGPWDELALWFGLPPEAALPEPAHRPASGQLYAPHSWGSLRALRYTSRPSHADQLHFDLWWRGSNLALDAGTYAYNAPPPWDNPLTSSLVHNTVTVDGQEQMTRVSRFLYLNWSEAWLSYPSAHSIIGHTQPQRRLKIAHTRLVTVSPCEGADERWRIDDKLLNPEGGWHTYRLHWLLPDGKWELEPDETQLRLHLELPPGQALLTIQTTPGLENPAAQITLVRAGQVLWGQLDDCPPTRGWVSPTYNQKNPALSLAVSARSNHTVRFTTEFYLTHLEERR